MAITAFVMVLVVGVLFVSIVAARSRARGLGPGGIHGPDSDAGWMPAVMGAGGSDAGSDCGRGDTACDGGSGDGGGGD